MEVIVAIFFFCKQALGQAMIKLRHPILGDEANVIHHSKIFLWVEQLFGNIGLGRRVVTYLDTMIMVCDILVSVRLIVHQVYHN